MRARRAEPQGNASLRGKRPCYRELALQVCRGETLTVTPDSHMHKASEDTLYKFLQYTSVPDW